MSSSSESEDPVDKYILNRARPDNARQAEQHDTATTTPSSAGRQDKAGGTSSKPDAAKDVRPIGVVVVEDDADVNMEVNRLLRQPRYFDDNYDPGRAITCWRCGKRGHLSRDCSSGVSCKPCYLCAQYGHEARSCPHRLCFRCGQTGHVVNDCKNAASTSKAVCLRCGKDTCPCAARGDAYRYQVGCTEQYAVSDMQRVRCASCGQLGHLSCAPYPTDLPALTCCNCGGTGHSMAQCTEQMQRHLQAEKMADERRARERLDQQRYSSYAAAHNGHGSYGGGGGGQYSQQGGRAHGGSGAGYSDQPAYDYRGQGYQGHGGGGGGYSDPYSNQQRAPKRARW